MSDVELEVQPDDDHPSLDDDNAHQACYIFESSFNDDVNGHEPAKKRRKTKSPPAEQPSTFPLLDRGTESAHLARVRHETFEKVWAQYRTRINGLVDGADEATLAEVVNFIESPEKGTSDKLRTGLIIAGPGGGTQTSLIDHLDSARTRPAATTIIVQLQANHCINLQSALKHLIKRVISSEVGQDGYHDFLNKHKRLIPMNFDLELLQIFVQEKDIQSIVVSILDVETFDIGILSELLLTVSSWTESIPFAVLLGLATTAALFESRLPRSVVDILDATIFTMHSADQLLTRVLDEIRQMDDGRVELGPLTVSALEELIEGQGMTIDTFARAVKYTIMSHFFANSLSVLLSDEIATLNAEQSLCSAIRNTPSFRRYCEDILNTKSKSSTKEIFELLSDDDKLLRAALAAVDKTAKVVSSGKKSTSPVTWRLTEAYQINTRQILNPFIPRPRHAIERALSKPADYLGCECCQSAATMPSLASQTTTVPPPPSSTLYILLQEAGTVINVRDLYDAFCARRYLVGSAEEEDEQEDESNVHLTTEKKADRKQLSVFYTALAELKMLGLVKSSTSAVIRKRALASSGVADSDAMVGMGLGVGRGRDRYGDVDFVAKTGWAGL